MQIYTEIAKAFMDNFTPEQLVRFLPMVLNITHVILQKGDARLTPETALFLQTEIEKLRGLIK